MHRKLANRFQDLEQARHRLLSLTEGYTRQQVTFTPGDGQWSMAQVMQHLVMTETQILHYVQRRLEKGSLSEADYKSWLRYMLVKLALRYRKKIKAPKQVAAPPSDLDPAKVKEAWSQLRQQWATTLNTIPDDLLSKNMFRHPMAGDMSIGHTLGFMAEHVRHHMAQIRRIRQSANWQ
jgi:uncharacterized damage-inducible protein DinB